MRNSKSPLDAEQRGRARAALSQERRLNDANRVARADVNELYEVRSAMSPAKAARRAAKQDMVEFDREAQQCVTEKTVSRRRSPAVRDGEAQQCVTDQFPET